MTPSDATLLINGKRISKNVRQQWADLGCGNGLFSKALLRILPAESIIYAIDQKPFAFSNPGIQFTQLDFDRDPLPVSSLDGIMMINSLHYINDKLSLLQRLKTKLLPSGAFIIAEYEMNRANSWVPYPITYAETSKLFKMAGFDSIEKIHERSSELNNTMIYSVYIYNSKSLA